jgi:hypothetical protein
MIVSPCPKGETDHVADFLGVGKLGGSVARFRALPLSLVAKAWSHAPTDRIAATWRVELAGVAKSNI